MAGIGLRNCWFFDTLRKDLFTTKEKPMKKELTREELRERSFAITKLVILVIVFLKSSWSVESTASLSDLSLDLQEVSIWILVKNFILVVTSVCLIVVAITGFLGKDTVNILVAKIKLPKKLF